jgi:glutamate-5-semialdehyde dehydrogenase
VVFFIYESRPNVTADAAALCLRSGNAVILRGGKEARHSNAAIADCVEAACKKAGLPRASAALVRNTDRALVPQFLGLGEFIDLAIPRGGASLIRATVDAATMPVLKHFDGNCHLFIDASADSQMATDIALNAKTSRPGVCNAIETLLLHADYPHATELLEKLAEAGVTLHADAAARQLHPNAIAATEEDWGREYLSLDLAVAVVPDVEAAIAHINRHGSRHTDAIVTQNMAAADAFLAGVDAASVMLNASPRFADGGQYGLGAEIGISTDKLHARGPMGAADLCTSKWIVTGNGHVRE